LRIQFVETEEAAHLVLPRSPAAWGIETPDVAMQITNVVRGRLGEEGN
jgi:hypothetical protein